VPQKTNMPVGLLSTSDQLVAGATT